MDIKKKKSWTTWILFQEVQIWRQITKNCLWIFSVIKLNLNIKINILSFGSTLGLIWRLSRYGSMPPCMSKYMFIRVRILILMLKIAFGYLEADGGCQRPFRYSNNIGGTQKCLHVCPNIGLLEGIEIMNLHKPFF